MKGIVIEAKISFNFKMYFLSGNENFYADTMSCFFTPNLEGTEDIKQTKKLLRLHMHEIKPLTEEQNMSILNIMEETDAESSWNTNSKEVEEIRELLPTIHTIQKDQPICTYMDDQCVECELTPTIDLGLSKQAQRARREINEIRGSRKKAKVQEASTITDKTHEISEPELKPLRNMVKNY